MIDSTANPTVKALRALTAPKARRERRLFLVEGVRAVEDGLRAGSWPEICLYDPDLVRRTERGAKLLHELLHPRNSAHANRQMLEATQKALEAASDTLHPQGVVAAFPMPQWPDRAAASEPPLALICDDIQDPGNMGTILRAAEAAGVAGVWLTPRCVDLYNPKVVRAAMGAHFRLPAYESLDWATIKQKLANLGITASRIYATEAGERTPYDLIDWRQEAGLIISNEAHGLSAEARQTARDGGYLSIPMVGGTESLNAAVAAAVILFEAARQRRNG